MFEVHMQNLPVSTPFLAKFFPQVFGLWFCLCCLFQRSPNLINHLAVPMCAPSTRHFHNLLQLSTFFCGACQVSSGILLGHCFFLSWAKAFSSPLSKEVFPWFFCFLLPASFLGLGFAFSTFSKADAGLFSAFSKAAAGLSMFFPESVWAQGSSNSGGL